MRPTSSAWCRASSVVGALTRYCTRPAHRRAELEAGDAGRHVGEVVREQRLEPGLHPVARFQVLGHDHGLGDEVVVELHVERQVEADGAAADIGGEADDVGIAGERLLEPLRRGFGRRDRGVLRQGHRHQQLGPVGGREELLLHEAHAVDRGAEGDERGADREPAVPHGEAEQAGEERA